MEKSEIIKKMNLSLKQFKNSRDYMELLNQEAAKQLDGRGFACISEKSYYKYMREYAVKKSNFVALFSNTEQLNDWLQSTTVQNRNYIYDLVKSNDLEINSKEISVLSRKEEIINHGHHIDNCVYNINPQYSKHNVQVISDIVNNNCEVDGEEHFKTQELANQVMKKSTRNFDAFQNTARIFYEKFGKEYDDLFFVFRQAINVREVQKIGNAFIIESYLFDKNQTIKYSVNEKNEISEVSIMPPSIKDLNNKFRSHQENVTKSLKIS